MAVIVLNHTLVGRDAAYMQTKLRLLLAAIGQDVSKGNYQAKRTVDQYILDPSVDTSKVIAVRNGQPVTLAEGLQDMSDYGNGVHVIDGVAWIFIVPDAAVPAIQAILAQIKGIA